MSKKSAIFVFAVIALAMLVLAGCSVSEAQPQNLDAQRLYTITYYVEGERHSVSVKQNSDYTVDVPQLEGYEFEGLFTQEEGGERYVSAEGNSDEPFSDDKDIALYAHFSVKRVTVRFFSAAGDLLGSACVDSGTPFVSVAPACLQDGTVVTAWSLGAGNGPFTEEAVYADSDFYVYDCIYKIRLDDGFGNAETFNVPLGESFVLPVMSRDGYEFLGWQDGDGVLQETVTPYRSETFTAQWSGEAYTVYLNAGEDILQTSQTVTFGKPFALPVPARSGYIFAGWYANGEKLTDSLGRGASWNKNCAVLASARWLKSSARFYNGESYVITDSGRAKQHKDVVALSQLLGAPLSDYLQAGATKLEVRYSLNVAEIDDGYQYLFLSNDDRGRTLSNELLFTQCIQHNPFHTDENSYAHEGVVTVPLAKVADTVYLLYGASGLLNDDWIRGGIEVIFTVC